MDTMLIIIISGLFGLSIVFLLVGLAVFIDDFRLDRYLRKHDYQTWRSLRSFGKGESFVGAVNPFKSFKYINSKAGEHDLNILKLKDSIRYKEKWLGILLLTLMFQVLWLLIYCKSNSVM